jgi:hypothetical protein
MGVALSESTSTSRRSARSSSFCATPKALLLVDDHEAELLGDHVAAEDAVRPDQHVDLAGLEVGDHLPLFLRAAEAGDHLDPHREVAIALAEGVPVLLGEDRGGDEHQRLLAIHRDGEGRAHRHLGLAEPHVAADEPVHRPRRLEVLLHCLDRGALVLRLAVRELRLEPLEPLVLELVRDPGRLLPPRVEREQLACQLAQARPRAALQVLPRLATELAQRRGGAVGADVLRDLADLLMRHVQAVVAAEADEEVVAGDLGHGLRLEAEQLPDPVVLVDDEVAGAQVGEALQRPPGRRGPGARALAEDLGVRQQNEAEVAPDEAAPRGRDGEGELRLVGEPVARLEDSRLDASQQVRRAQRLAAVREGDDNAVAGTDEPGKLGLGLGQAARRDGGPLSLEGEGLAARERLELRGARERQLLPELLAPRLANVVRLPDQVWRTIERRDEVARDGRRLVVVAEGRLCQVGSALGRGVDDGAVHVVQRTLGERRERAHRFDLVAEKLDPQRLAPRRREDVDQSAADGELAALLDAVDPLVAGKREALR